MPASPGTVIPSGTAVVPGGDIGMPGVAGVAGNYGDAEVGTIKAWPSVTPPSSWALANGAAVSRTLYPALFSLIGTTFGVGDGVTTFNLPDLRSRMILGSGQGTGLSVRNVADIGGEETHGLTIAELPAHNHTASVGDPTHAHSASTSVAQPGHAHTVYGTLIQFQGLAPPSGNNAYQVQGSTAVNNTSSNATGDTASTSVAAAGTGISVSIANAGSGLKHNTMPPFLVLTWLIKVSLTGGATAQAPIADTTQPGLVNELSGSPTDYLGGDNQCHPVALVKGFLLKTGAYSVAVSDNQSYLICSGGSWTLTLPAAQLGLQYNVRNDQGITGTTGTITIAPTGGTIDNLASLPLLPGQECQILCDGTNWRTFGRQRNVVIGTLDITASVANAVLLLPLGYRYFEIEIHGYVPVTTSTTLVAQLSSDGGNTFITTNSYFDGVITEPSTTTVTFSTNESGTSFRVCGPEVVAGSNHGSVLGTLFPGNGTQAPIWLWHSGARLSTPMSEFRGGSGVLSSLQIMNAIKFFAGSGNIQSAFFTVKGIV